jgi:hypothetical protein
METLRTTVDKTNVHILSTEIKYGIMAGMGYTIYFLIMKWFNLINVLELRALNFVILASFLFLMYKKLAKDKGLEYFEGLKSGAYYTVSSVLLFGVFLLIYLYWDSNFMAYINENTPFNLTLTPVTATAVVVFEGIISGLIASFSFMQYFKREK